jgi:hypothetical protein
VNLRANQFAAACETARIHLFAQARSAPAAGGYVTYSVGGDTIAPLYMPSDTLYAACAVGHLRVFLGQFVPLKNDLPWHGMVPLHTLGADDEIGAFIHGFDSGFCDYPRRPDPPLSLPEPEWFEAGASLARQWRRLRLYTEI